MAAGWKERGAARLKQLHRMCAPHPAPPQPPAPQAPNHAAPTPPHLRSNKSEHDDGGEGRLVIDLFDEWLAGWRQRAARRSHEGGAPAGLPPRLFTVGRLDVQSVGLIFVTNDGDWAHK
mgnify:CR=1 FL=1